MKECENDDDDYKKEKTDVNKNESAIHRDIVEKENEITGIS